MLRRRALASAPGSQEDHSERAPKGDPVIERSNSHIDVDELMAAVHRRLSSDADTPRVSSPSDATTLAAAAENNLNSAQRFAQVRTSVGSTNRLLALPIVRALLLRVLALVFRDQRNVDNATIDAVRKLLHLNVCLSEKTDFLESRIAKLEAALSERSSKKPL